MASFGVHMLKFISFNINLAIPYTCTHIKTSSSCICLSLDKYERIKVVCLLYIITASEMTHSVGDSTMAKEKLVHPILAARSILTLPPGDSTETKKTKKLNPSSSAYTPILTFSWILLHEYVYSHFCVSRSFKKLFLWSVVLCSMAPICLYCDKFLRCRLNFLPPSFWVK